MPAFAGIMKKYEVIEHTADLKIRVFGKTKEELFLNALAGMTEGLKPEIKKPREKTERKIKLKSPDISSLLVDFLSEVLYLSQVNRTAFDKVEFGKFSETELEGKLKGKKAERFGEDIKAATYHDLNVSQKDGVWEATILFDI